jgi:excisionase family DNA binding protein
MPSRVQHTFAFVRIETSAVVPYVAVHESKEATMGELDLSFNVPSELLNNIALEVADRVERIVEQRLEAGREGWITADDAAKHLACSRHRIYALVHERWRDFPYSKDGSRLLFRRSELDTWLEQQRPTTAAPGRASRQRPQRTPVPLLPIKGERPN